MKSREFIIVWVGCLLGIAPLWMGQHLPMVDLPQHLHLISVLHRLNDATTLYPQWFEARGELTPYVGYYYLVSGLNWLMPIEAANRLFLSAYIVGFIWAWVFLLRSLKTPTWPALLTVPFAYGDNFGWGFINYLSAIPLAVCACAFLLRCVEDSARRRTWALWLAVMALSTLLFHVQMYFFLGLALPFLWATAKTPAAESFFQARKVSLWALTPSVAVFLFWVLGRLGKPAEIGEGEPWKAWGPLWAARNWSFKPFSQNVDELFSVPANVLRDQSDGWGFYAALGVMGLSMVARLGTGPKPSFIDGRRFRLEGLAFLALALFLFMPFDIHGYMYYLNTRYAQVFWPLWVCCVPALPAEWTYRFRFAALLPALLVSFTFSRGIGKFNQEASALDRLSQKVSEKPTLMGLLYNPMSAVVRHPVYLHAASTLARQQGGITHFSFARTPHSPVKYRNQAPPTYPSEWRPQQFDEITMGGAYDWFLVRGASPFQLFSPSFMGGLRVAAQSGGFILLGRTKPTSD